MSEKKRGALSASDMDFIRKYIDKMSPEEMAARLNRKVDPVLRYIERNRIGQKFAEARQTAEKSEHDLYKDLRGKIFWKSLREQLSQQELDYFAEHWIQLVLQFNGDLAPSEEMELKELLILEILKNRETSAERARLVLKDELENQIKEERKKGGKIMDRELIRELNQQLTNLAVTSSGFVKTFKELCDRADKMRKALHASRQDRVKGFEDAKMDFVAFLRRLEERGEKIKVGREMEIVRMAKEREHERLGSFHQFADGKVDRPLLTEDTVLNEDTNDLHSLHN